MQYLDHFEDWANTEEFDARMVIFSANEPADALYVILSGAVALSFHGESLSLEKRGGIIGEMALIEAAKRNLTATAVTHVRAARLSRSQLKDLIDRDSEFAFHAMATLANRLRVVDGFISRQLDS